MQNQKLETQNIRNFSIIAHIDHGKSTLADRMLEVTKTIEKRKMKDQVLDQMELERERGITIKMQPVRMEHTYAGKEYVLNLIDTPGHIDFSYEVSRALKAVEGTILLVDSTQGVQAQTLGVLRMAKESGLTIIPVLSKIDSPLARVEEVLAEVSNLLEVEEEEILLVSGKTGEGVSELLDQIIRRIPPVESTDTPEQTQALIFDFKYSTHKGIVVFVRVFGGSIERGQTLQFAASGTKFNALEVGIFAPEETKVPSLTDGSIGYIVTGIKEASIAAVGDTIIDQKSVTEPLPGYMSPKPVVWSSIFPESQDDFADLKLALERLKLTDSSLSFEEESSGALGRGFRCGFLGLLHLEIITERLRREHNLTLIITSPSVEYEVTLPGKEPEIVYAPTQFPEHGSNVLVREPWVEVKLITPGEYLGKIMQLLHEHEAELGDSETFGDDRTSLYFLMPLRELYRNFFDEIKSVSSGYASLTYEYGGMKEADVVRLDVLVAEEIVPAFSRVVSRRVAEQEAKKLVKRLYDIIPKQQFVTKIQGKAMGRIIASKTLSAMRKDVTGHLYGGDITRKMKLLEKQKKGKKKALARGKVRIPPEVFIKAMKSE